MKYKVFLLMICLMFLSACNATYNIEINKNNSSNETITINGINNYYNKNEINDVIKDIFPSLSNVTYNINNNNLIINRINSKFYDLDGNYTIDKEFGKLKIDLNKISFKPDYDKCIFLFSDGGDYDENGKKIVSNDKIEINLTIPFKIKTSNADKINNNTYTWTYDIKQCNKELYIEFYKSKVSTYILLFIGLIIVTICVIVIKRRKLEQF